MKSWTVTLMLLVAALTGCADGAKLTVRSIELPKASLEGSFDTAVYEVDDANSLHVMLIAGDPVSPTRAMHVRMFWWPRAGRTPIDERAANVIVRYVVFEGEAVGVYGGAGFLLPHSKPGAANFRASLRDAALRLADATDGYEDAIGLAVASGSITARRDSIETKRLLRQLELQLHERLGYPRFVHAQ